MNSDQRQLKNNITLLLLFSLVITSCDTFEKGKVYPDITGAWSCQENSPYSGYKKYLIEFDQVQSQESLYIISNFHNQGYENFIYATLSGDSIYIENQVVNGIFIDGSGKVNPEFNDLEMTYHTDDGSIQLKYFAACTR